MSSRFKRTGPAQSLPEQRVGLDKGGPLQTQHKSKPAFSVPLLVFEDGVVHSTKGRGSINREI